MAFLPDQLQGQGWKGFLLVLGFAALATYLASFPAISGLGISPLIIGILLGALFGNTLRRNMPAVWSPGIVFSAKKVLRLAIILYGFRITFQQVAQVGMAGLAADVLMLGSTFLLGCFLGIRLLKLDPKLTYLIASGASVCGAAAVLATEPVVKAEAHKTAMAIATVVLFGTLAMFLYPVLYKAGLFQLGLRSFGIYVGATVHEVAHVVAAGNAISAATADTAVIVKMTRVMLLVPLLLLLSLYLAGRQPAAQGEARQPLLRRITIPWFAVGFIAVAGFNSLGLLPLHMVNGINWFDTFLLTIAMTALGMETHAGRLKVAGSRPVLLAFFLFIWLLLAGYVVSRLLEAWLP